MGIYITRINGLSIQNSLQYRQSMVAEIAHQLGFREMGIYRYPADGERPESLSSRLDGIIAGINADDIVICQFPTGNGIKFERQLINRLKAYRGRVAVFIHDMDALIRKDNWPMLSDTIGLYNQAEVLIVPSYTMRQFLLEHGVRKNIKFIVQEMWDYTVKVPLMKNPEYRREIHYADSNGFEELNKWDYEVPLKQYGNPDESFSELSKGGFGLVWYGNRDYYQYMKYSVPFSLGRYLAAGIPVIVPAEISNQTLIETNHLGVIANSLNEAAAAVKDMNESEYQEYVQSVKSFAPALREGYYTKKVLVDTIQAFYREDANRIMIPSISYSLNACKFNSIILRESYNGILALSWSFKGDVDGFLICDASGVVIHDTRNLHQHYLLMKGHKIEEDFMIKAYVDTLKGKLVVAEGKAVYRNAEQLGKIKVSIVIPAYNAENHIARSIDTVLAQSFTDLEVVVVDDGSTDHTPEIIDWYSEKYANVIVINQENKGAAEARNAGIAYARGKYIGFLDSDDMIYPNMIERLYYAVKKNDCDIAITSFYYMTSDNYEISVFSQYPMDEDVAVNVDDFFDMHSTIAYQSPVVWNKLYRTALVKEIRFPLIPYEDEAWLPCVLSFANQICYIDEGLYEWDRSMCTDTLSTRLEHDSNDKIFKDHKMAILFYLENGNQMRLEKLKRLAQRELNMFGRVYKNTKCEYEKLWSEIDEAF